MVTENCFHRCVGSAARAVFGGFLRDGAANSVFNRIGRRLAAPDADGAGLLFDGSGSWIVVWARRAFAGALPLRPLPGRCAEPAKGICPFAAAPLRDLVYFRKDVFTDEIGRCWIAECGQEHSV